MKSSVIARSARPAVLVGAALVLLAFLFLATGAGGSAPASAAPAKEQFPALSGDPGITHASATGYYIWRDENGFHLRTHGPGKRHTFTARLHTDGVFTNVDAVRLENKDNFAIVDGGHTILLKFHTYDYTDGINFQVQGGSYVRFNLQLDGKLVPTDHIFLGKDLRHPANNPFTLRR